jgi:hypothetical protein
MTDYVPLDKQLGVAREEILAKSAGVPIEELRSFLYGVDWDNLDEHIEWLHLACDDEIVEYVADYYHTYGVYDDDFGQGMAV